MAKIRPTLKITKREEAFCNDIIVDGVHKEEAYRTHWATGSKNDSEVRYLLKKMMQKENVAKFIEQLLFDRQQSKYLDESFVIERLKEAANNNRNTPTGIRALELLGKTMGMFKERQVVEDLTGHRASATELFELAKKQRAGEDITKEIAGLSDKTDGTEIYDFKVG